MKRYGLFFWDLGLCQLLVSELFTVEIQFSATVINSSFLAGRRPNTFWHTVNTGNIR